MFDFRKKHFNGITCLAGAWEGRENLETLNQVVQYTDTYNKHFKIEKIPEIGMK